MYYSFIGFFSHFKLYLFHDLKDQKRVLHFFVVSVLPTMELGHAQIGVPQIGKLMSKLLYQPCQKIICICKLKIADIFIMMKSSKFSRVLLFECLFSFI